MHFDRLIHWHVVDACGQLADKIRSERRHASSTHANYIPANDGRQASLSRRGSALGRYWISGDRPSHGFKPVHGSFLSVPGLLVGSTGVQGSTLNREDRAKYKRSKESRAGDKFRPPVWHGFEETTVPLSTVHAFLGHEYRSGGAQGISLA